MSSPTVDNTETQHTVAVTGSVKTAGSVAVTGSVVTAGSVAVAGNVATAGSVGVLGSVAIGFSAGIKARIGCLACVGSGEFFLNGDSLTTASPSTELDGASQEGRPMELDEIRLQEAKLARDRLIGLQHEAELAQVSYQHAMRRLHTSGGSLREIADALGLSYQRVHQIVDVTTGKGAVKEYRSEGACSCGTAGSDVRLVAGPKVFICEWCLALSREPLGDGAQRVNEWTRLVDLGPDSRKARCSFCGRRRDRVTAMVEAPRRSYVGKFQRRPAAPRICSECTTLCDEILSEELGA